MGARKIDIIRKYKKIYNDIKVVESSIFNNEKVYFNQKGFRHLIMKEGKYRTHSEQIRRVILVPYIKDVISTSEFIDSNRLTLDIEFWSMSKNINGQKITVIIKQRIGDGKKYFVSIMNKKLPKNAKAPFGTS